MLPSLTLRLSNLQPHIEPSGHAGRRGGEVTSGPVPRIVLRGGL